MNNMEKCPIKSPATASRIIDGEAVIVIPDKSEVKVLNLVGSRIWDLCDGNRTICKIVDIIYNEFEGKRSNIERDVLNFVDDLEKRGMLAIKTK